MQATAAQIPADEVYAAMRATCPRGNAHAPVKRDPKGDAFSFFRVILCYLPYFGFLP